MIFFAFFALFAVNSFTIKLKAPPSNGTRGESRGATQVNALTLTKIPCCDATGMRASVTLFRYAAFQRLYPCSITGAPELGYLVVWSRLLTLNHRSPIQLGGPFDFCAFASLSPLSLGSLEIALKCTRPRQRFYYIGRYSMTEGGGCQEGE